MFSNVIGPNDKNLLDFLPFIYKNNKEDIQVLEKWMQYFRKLDVLYLIEDCGEYCRLWKEEEI